jgi:hypothetical protein
MSTTSFRAIVVISDGSTEEKSSSDLVDVQRMARCFGCRGTEIVVCGDASLGMYSFMVGPRSRLSPGSEEEDPENAFLAWLGEAIDPERSPIRYAEILFDGEHGSTGLGRYSADGVRVDALAALNIPRG